jgi:hypothetical protein
MNKNLFQITIIEDGKSHTEEYVAFIGIKIKDNHAMLDIRENGSLPDSFWRNLPDAMKVNIEHGLESRRKSLVEDKKK